MNATNYDALQLFKSISVNVKHLANGFTHPANVCEFLHILLSASSISIGHSYNPFIALFFFVVLLEGITAVSDWHSCVSLDFSSWKFLLVACLDLLVEGVDVARYDSLWRSSELLSTDGIEGAAVVLVVASSW